MEGRVTRSRAKQGNATPLPGLTSSRTPARSTRTTRSRKAAAAAEDEQQVAPQTLFKDVEPEITPSDTAPTTDQDVTQQPAVSACVSVSEQTAEVEGNENLENAASADSPAADSADSGVAGAVSIAAEAVVLTGAPAEQTEDADNAQAEPSPSFEDADTDMAGVDESTITEPEAVLTDAADIDSSVPEQDTYVESEAAVAEQQLIEQQEPAAVCDEQDHHFDMGAQDTVVQLAEPEAAVFEGFPAAPAEADTPPQPAAAPSPTFQLEYGTMNFTIGGTTASVLVFPERDLATDDAMMMSPLPQQPAAADVDDEEELHDEAGLHDDEEVFDKDGLQDDKEVYDEDGDVSDEAAAEVVEEVDGSDDDMMDAEMEDEDDSTNDADAFVPEVAPVAEADPSFAEEVATEVPVEESTTVAVEQPEEPVVDPSTVGEQEAVEEEEVVSLSAVKVAAEAASAAMASAVAGITGTKTKYVSKTPQPATRSSSHTANKGSLSTVKATSKTPVFSRTPGTKATTPAAATTVAVPRQVTFATADTPGKAAVTPVARPTTARKSALKTATQSVTPGAATATGSETSKSAKSAKRVSIATPSGPKSEGPHRAIVRTPYPVKSAIKDLDDDMEEASLPATPMAALDMDGEEDPSSPVQTALATTPAPAVTPCGDDVEMGGTTPAAAVMAKSTSVTAGKAAAEAITKTVSPAAAVARPSTSYSAKYAKAQTALASLAAAESGAARPSTAPGSRIPSYMAPTSAALSRAKMPSKIQTPGATDAKSPSLNQLRREIRELADKKKAVAAEKTKVHTDLAAVREPRLVEKRSSATENIVMDDDDDMDCEQETTHNAAAESVLTDALNKLDLGAKSTQVTGKLHLRGMPAPQGRHVRFNDKGKAVQTPGTTKVTLLGLPTASGKHLRFQD